MGLWNGKCIKFGDFDKILLRFGDLGVYGVIAKMRQDSIWLESVILGCCLNLNKIYENGEILFRKIETLFIQKSVVHCIEPSL